MQLRRKESLSRLTGLFRRMGPETSALRAQTHYPVVELSSVTSSQPVPYVYAPSGTTQARGRRRNRFRRTFRQSYRLPISLGLKVGCINTQGLRWDLTSHAEKLKALLLLARKFLMLTELHYDETVQLRFQVVYMEEWLLICRGQVGLLLRNSVAQLWEQQGRPSFALDASDRLAGIAVCIHGRKLALVSVYSPAGADVGSKRRHYTHAQQLCNMLKDETLEICIGGDFNGHIGVNDGFGQQVGNKGLHTPTTLGGRLLKEFVATSDLVHLDSWKPIKHRGTWRHARTSQWYELDGFLLSSSLYAAVQPGMSTFSTSGILSDHMGKRMHLHLGSLEKHAVRKARKMLWKRRSRGRAVAEQTETRVRCNASALRGNSAETRHRIKQYQKLVESRMDELQVSPVPAAPACVEGWEEQDASALHIYTDGGADPPMFRDNKVQVPSTAGWGLAAWLAGDAQDYFGPVVCSPTESGFLGAQRATNNWRTVGSHQGLPAGFVAGF